MGERHGRTKGELRPRQSAPPHNLPWNFRDVFFNCGYVVSCSKLLEIWWKCGVGP